MVVINGNPTIFELLQLGCRITLEDGRWLKGELQNKYIEIGSENCYLGAYDLSLDGLNRALKDQDFLNNGKDFEDLADEEGDFEI